MKKVFTILTTLLFVTAGSQLVLAAQAPKAKAQTQAAKPAAKPVVQQSKEPTPQDLINEMKPGFDFSGNIDIKIFDMVNSAYGETSDWYFYPVYRMALANVFDKENFGLFADVEKPGYANITYPFIKVNELYAKFQQDNFYVKLGRQLFGDTQDLLLGFQHDAVTLGFDLDKIDLMFFIARTDLYAPWGTGGKIESMIGFTPYFNLGDTMGLRGYLLIGNEPITITSGTPPTAKDAVNTLILLGGRYMLDMPAGDAGHFGLNGQLGIQFGMAKTAADDSIDATALGLKLDGMYGMQSTPDFGFELGAHIVYTGGDPEPLLNTKCGFASLNSLPGSGPGLFSKIQDGAGAYTYLDGHSASLKIQNYVGVLSLGFTGEFAFNSIKPGVGLWIYSNTDKDGKSLGTELNAWLVYQASKIVSFYGQVAMFMPNREGIGWPPSPATAPNNATKLLIGSSINF
ncbi:MAG: hypothetical protein AB1439_12695 [candidate division FCPU426 bacterium]